MILTLLRSYTSRLDFYTVGLDFRIPQFLSCIYTFRLNCINSVREPCLFGSRTELMVYGQFGI